MVSGIRAYLRSPVHPNPEERIRHQLANRKSIWLDIVQRAIFSGDHPYREMFRHAGCTFEDLSSEVERHGLEPTLERLHGDGVYLTHDEFKGKQPILRGGKTILASTSDFANPLTTGGLRAESGGSRSPGTETRLSTQFKLYTEGYYHLAARQFDLAATKHIQVKPILPAVAGLGWCLGCARIGTPPDRWFSASGPAADSAHYRTLTASLVAMARLHGLKVPYPEHLPPDDFSAVAGLVADYRRQGIPCHVNSYTSPGVRVAVAALEAGLDISGTVFSLSGEQLTEAKRQTIQSAGCEVCDRYWIAEVGPVGFACQHLKGRGIHLFRDSLAVISCPKKAPFSDVDVDVLLFTNLLPSAPFLLINADMDDSGVIKPVECDCVFRSVGFTDGAFDISSFGKLTGMGMTLVGTDVVNLLEDVLPARFGGGPGDYQLVEEEGQRQTELVLRISPRLGGVSLQAVEEFFLAEIRSFYGGALASRVWKHAGALRATQEQPVMTSSGKIMALHLLGSSRLPDALKSNGS